MDSIMSFPEEEYEQIKADLERLGYCYTTRVFKERNKYLVGNRYKTKFGIVVEIMQKDIYNKVSDHPYYEYLMPEQKALIAKYSEDIGEEYEVIKFKAVKADDEYVGLIN